MRSYQLRFFVMRREVEKTGRKAEVDKNLSPYRRKQREEAYAKGASDAATGRIRFAPTDHVREEMIEIRPVGRARMGDAAEAAFMARACSLNFHVAKPWGNGEPYDVLVAVGRGFWRVQVKCATFYQDYSYRIKGGNKVGCYTKEQIDFLAAHVIPENAWYIVPVEAFEGKNSLNFNPGVRRARGKYEKYREAWCLLVCPPKARGWKDIPVVCRCKKQLPIRCAVCPCRREI